MPKKAIVIYSALLVLTVLGFGWYLVASSRAPDFWQFVLDRREGAGQTAPDKKASCTYTVVDDQTVSVTRKAHGHYADHELTLSSALLDEHYGVAQALFETSTSADTYNCINGEFLSHELIDPAEDPIVDVQYSASDRNIVVETVQQNGQHRVETFTFQTNKEASTWNAGFGPEDSGLVGEIQSLVFEGESLVVVLKEAKGVAVHTYNFRKSHKDNPWNEQSDQHESLRVQEAVGAPELLERGRSTEIMVRENGIEEVRSFRFTCKREPKIAEEACIWQ